MERRLLAILLADIVGYTRLMERDQVGTRLAIAQVLQSVWLPTIAKNGGTLVSDAGGDSILATFPTSLDAAATAVSVQEQMGAQGSPPELRIVYRIGLHASDVLLMGSRIEGMGINIAARLERIASPGGICLSRAMRDCLPAAVRSEFVSVGAHHLKNVSEAMEVFAWRQLAVYPLADDSAVTMAPEYTTIILEGRDSAGHWHSIGIAMSELTASDGGLILGREAAACNRQINHPSVSRRHARLWLADKTVMLKDLGSRYGTMVGSITLAKGQSTAILPGNRTVLGRVELTARMESEALSL